MTEDNVLGNAVSLQWDKIDGEDWILIKDAGGELIMKVQRVLWESSISSFTPAIRSSILQHAMRLYG